MSDTERADYHARLADEVSGAHDEILAEDDRDTREELIRDHVDRYNQYLSDNGEDTGPSGEEVLDRLSDAPREEWASVGGYYVGAVREWDNNGYVSPGIEPMPGSRRAGAGGYGGGGGGGGGGTNAGWSEEIMSIMGVLGTLKQTISGKGTG